jgi:Pyruvate/2-oxoacid:ferredoxin oxidoreductase delta subunit
MGNMLNKPTIGKTCISCDACRLNCPENAIITDGKEFIIDQWACNTCGICLEICPEDAISIKTNPDQQTR